MEITTKGMATIKSHLINLMATIYFTNHQNRVFKEVSIHYLCKKLPWTWISKVYTWIKPKVSVPWQWNSVNEAIILLPKDVSSNFAKTMLYLRNIIKIVSDR